MIAAPLIVTATFAGPDFQRLDGLRRQYYPSARNRVPAHITLFHHLPPSELDALRTRLQAESRAPAPPARLVAVRLLGRGVAIDVDSAGLEDIRERLADAFTPVLLPQDRAPWRPHVTIQNKVEPDEARATADRLRKTLRPTPLALNGLALWAYRGGPWERLALYPFHNRR